MPLPNGARRRELLGDLVAEALAADDSVDGLDPLRRSVAEHVGAWAANASRKASTRSASISSPAAARWPP